MSGPDPHRRLAILSGRPAGAGAAPRPPIAPPPAPRSRVRRGFWRRHWLFAGFIGFAIVALLTADWMILVRRRGYEHEIARLDAGMTSFERRKSAAILDSDHERRSLMMQLIRRQAAGDPEVHVAISVDSGTMYLERRGALLRASAVDVGPGGRVGVPPDTVHLAVPRGTRTVRQVLTDSTEWQVPRWVYRARGLPVPRNRDVRGALGPVAVLLDGGTIIYSRPSSGPLDDSSYVLPGSVRARAVDLGAIAPDLTPGTTVYFY